MYDIDKERRRNRVFIAVSVILVIGAASNFVLGYRGVAGWAVLLSCVASLGSALAGRRALSRLSATATDRGRAG